MVVVVVACDSDRGIGFNNNSSNNITVVVKVTEGNVSGNVCV